MFKLMLKSGTVQYDLMCARVCVYNIAFTNLGVADRSIKATADEHQLRVELTKHTHNRACVNITLTTELLWAISINMLSIDQSIYLWSNQSKHIYEGRSINSRTVLLSKQTVTVENQNYYKVVQPLLCTTYRGFIKDVML